MPSVVGAVVDALSTRGIDLAALGLAWARALPAVTLVPAFGLRALPSSARAVLGLLLAVSFYPAAVGDVPPPEIPWALAALGELVRGLPIAVAAAVPLWAATMAGGVIDAVRGGAELLAMPTVEGRATPLGVLLSLLAGTLFLLSGGPAHVAAALAASDPHPFAPDLLRHAVRDLSSGVTLAVALAGPILAASVIIDVGAALVARASAPAHVQSLLAPVRALAVLAIAALTLDRIAAFLAQTIL